MINFRKIIFAFVLLIAVLLASCGGEVGDGTIKDGGKITVVCSFFPVYDWVRSISAEAENISVELLVTNGVEMHSYQPSAADMVKIASSDLFIYVGGVSDAWVDAALESTAYKGRAVRLIDIISDSLICTDGHCAKGEHNHLSDEHIWLSLARAAVLCEEIAALLDVDASAYVDELNALDSAYRAAVSAAENRTVVVCDRFPFAYLMSDYGIDYHAAFPGCSAEANADFGTVAELVSALDGLALDYVIVCENSDMSVAKTVISGTQAKNQEILTLSSLQSVTSEQIDSGVTYLSVMRENLEVIKTALN